MGVEVTGGASIATASGSPTLTSEAMRNRQAIALAASSATNSWAWADPATVRERTCSAALHIASRVGVLWAATLAMRSSMSARGQVA